MDAEHAVDLLLARHGWQLLDRDTFVGRTLSALSEGWASEPRRAATQVYVLALYTACSGAEGAERQETAYRELYHYLYRSAYHRYPDVCEDAAQLAIERIFANFDRCREPAAFLAWAFQQLRDAARVLRREQQRPPRVSLDAAPVPDLAPLLLLLPAPASADPAVQLIEQETVSRVAGMVADFLREHPRAEQQLAALLLKHVWGLDDASIAQRLDKTVEGVYVLRSRAKKKLQEKSAWAALAREMGLL